MPPTVVTKHRLTKMRQLQAEGWCAKYIAEALNVSLRTVQRHLFFDGPAPPPAPGEVTGDEWPWPYGSKLIEPACGTVRIRRPGESTLEVDAAAVRQLAQAATPDLAEILAAAATEAERQVEALGECMGG